MIFYICGSQIPSTYTPTYTHNLQGYTGNGWEGWIFKVPPPFPSIGRRCFLSWSTSLYAKSIRHTFTDCQRKNRYVQIVCHTHINQATSLKFSGPVHHLMEQLMYKFHFYISNGIAFIPPFVTYPNFCIPTMKEKVHFNSIKLNTKKWLWNW